MLLNIPTGDRQSQLESKILAAALRQSLKRGDREGCLLVHSELSKLMAAYGQEIPGLELLRSGQASIPELGAIRTPEVTTAHSDQQAGGLAPESDNTPSGTAEASYPSDPLPAAAQTPLDYLDFDESAVHETAEGDQTGVEGSRLSGRTAPDPESRSYYSRLAAAPVDSSEMVHLCYIRAIRMLLRSQFLDGKAKALNPHDFRKQLKNLGIAYNILFDVSTRLDYDLRLLGLREPLSGKHLTVPEEAKTETNGKAKLSLVEVVVLSRTFGADTLLAAVSAARSLPEIEFWEYLAQTGAFAQLDFEALHFGTRLIRLGIVSVVQFEQAFQSVRTSGYSLEDILLHAGWVDAEQLRALNELTEESAEPAFQFIEAKVNDTRSPVQENIKVGGNLPSWASQMDWGGEEGSGESDKDTPLVVPLPVPPVEKAAASQIMDYLAPVEEPLSELNTPPETELQPQISFEPDSVTQAPYEEFAPTDQEAQNVESQLTTDSGARSPVLADTTISLDSVVLDFSSANDAETPAQSETSQPHFADTAALVDWELPEAHTGSSEPAQPAAESATDWSVVTPPAMIVGQYQPETPPVDIAPQGGTDWSRSGPADEAMPSTGLASTHPGVELNAPTSATPAMPAEERQNILADPMESLPKPLELSSWQEAVAQALVEPPVPQAMSSPTPDASLPEIQENLSAEIGEAPGGSWASAVEQILENQASKVTDNPTATAASQGAEQPTQYAKPEEQPAAEISEAASALPDAAQAVSEATTEAPADPSPEARAQMPMEAGSTTGAISCDTDATEATAELVKPPPELPPPAVDNPLDTLLETPLEDSAEPEADRIADSTIPTKDPRRPREKPARKPRSRREAKNAVQLSKLGTTDSRTQSNTASDSQNGDQSQPDEILPEATSTAESQSSPASDRLDETQLRQSAEPAAMADPKPAEQSSEGVAERSPAPPAVPAAQTDALSFLDIAAGFANSLPDAESRDLLLFGDPYAHFDASNLLTSESNLHSDSQIELENQSLMSALDPEISFAIPTPPATPHHEAVMEVIVPEIGPVEEPPQVIDASPEEPPGWSRFRLIFGESERALPVEGLVVKIGRNRQSVDIAVQEPAVSREHCQLEIGPEGVVLRDLESRHGTYIVRGDKEIRANRDTPIKLAHGDCIRLGKPGAPALEWIDTIQQIDENAPTDTFAAIPGTADYESLRETGPRNPKQSTPVREVLESSTPVCSAEKGEDRVEKAAELKDPTVKENENLAAAAAAMALSSGLGSDSIDAIMAAMLQPPATQAPPAAVPPRAVPPQTSISQDDADLAAAAAAMAASSGLSKDAIESIIAAMRTAKPTASNAPAEPTAAPSPPSQEQSIHAAPTEVDSPRQTSKDKTIPSPPTPPTTAQPDATQPLVVEVPLVPVPVPPVVTESETQLTHAADGDNDSHDTERSGSGSRIRATAENPYADIDALMAAIDAEVAMARKVIDEDDRKRKRMRQS